MKFLLIFSFFFFLVEVSFTSLHFSTIGFFDWRFQGWKVRYSRNLVLFISLGYFFSSIFGTSIFTTKFTEFFSLWRADSGWTSSLALFAAVVPHEGVTDDSLLDDSRRLTSVEQKPLSSFISRLRSIDRWMGESSFAEITSSMLASQGSASGKLAKNWFIGQLLILRNWWPN